jgi:hypothetical protein
VFVVSTDQLAQLASDRTRGFEQSLSGSLRAHYPAATVDLSDRELSATISATIARARQYDLQSEADHWRFVNLAAAFGWTFDTDPAFGWMRAMLTDAEVSAPSDRLHLLMDESIRRLRVLEHNARLRAAFATAGHQ